MAYKLTITLEFDINDTETFEKLMGDHQPELSDPIRVATFIQGLCLGTDRHSNRAMLNVLDIKGSQVLYGQFTGLEKSIHEIYYANAPLVTVNDLPF